MIGPMRHRLILQRRVSAPDAGGGIDLSWADIAGLWAEVTPVRGREASQAMRLVSLQTYRVRLRYRAGITTADRLVFNQKILNIRSLTDTDARGKWLECLCEEGVDS